MVRWSIELSEFSIQYKPCLALKGQIFVDFLAKVPQQDVDPGKADWWILNVDDTSQKTGAGVSLQLKAPTGERIKHSIQLNFPSSNNETEYEVILSEIDLATSVSSEKSSYEVTSQLVVGQVNRE